MRRSSQIVLKKWCITRETQNPAIVVVGKTSPLFFHLKSHFQLIFDLKHLENTLNTLLNQFMAVKKPTNRPKTRNPLEIIFFSELRYIVLGVLKVKKKTSKHNPPYHMKHFNIKINRFDG